MNPLVSPTDPKGAAGFVKTPLQLVPPAAMAGMAEVFRYGAKKYGPWNWREARVETQTYVAAMLRHLNAWRDGEDLDPDSGLSHIAHVASSCAILLDAAAFGTLDDNRPPPMPVKPPAAPSPSVPDAEPPSNVLSFTGGAAPPAMSHTEFIRGHDPRPDPRGHICGLTADFRSVCFICKKCAGNCTPSGPFGACSVCGTLP